MNSKKKRMTAPWVSLIIISSVLLVFLLWRSLYDAQDSSKELQFDNFRSNIIPTAEKGDTRAEEVDETMESRMKKLILGRNMARFQAVGYTCQTEQRGDQCFASHQVRIQNSTQTIIYIPSLSGSQTAIKTRRMIKPYTLKDDANAMQKVKPLQILEGNLRDTDIPTCRYHHHIPALVFSSGGHTPNMFHELDELLIPLFLTTYHFKSEVQFFITDYNSIVVNKYRKLLKRLSKYDPIDASTNGSTHCFPGAIIGLNYHANVAVNYSDIPFGYTMTDFRRFMYESYDLNASDMEIRRVRKRPVLVLISRSKSRVLLNENELVRLIEDLGFQVHVAQEKEMSNFEQFAPVLSRCDVLLGVHGAGLSNAVFLPQGAVMLQVVPLGLKYAAVYNYGDPAIRMGSRHVQYLIEPKESSLLDIYSPDDPVIVDPESIFAKGYIR